ncbi:MAG: hypothetical protein NDF55_07225 [archaeon GB-1867-005]|nr:hypothetical protein [Candidatus Culexmicrobium cathedralense]
MSVSKCDDLKEVVRKLVSERIKARPKRITPFLQSLQRAPSTDLMLNPVSYTNSPGIGAYRRSEQTVSHAPSGRDRATLNPIVKVEA